MAGTHSRGGSGSKHGKRRHMPYKTDHGVKPAPTNSEINVTPLVDVCLVLLIIFMVITPMLGRGVDVKLPRLVCATRHKEGDLVFASVTDEGAWNETGLYTEKDLLLGPLEEDLKAGPGPTRRRPQAHATTRHQRAGRGRRSLRPLRLLGLSHGVPDYADAGGCGRRRAGDLRPPLANRQTV